MKIDIEFDRIVKNLSPGDKQWVARRFRTWANRLEGKRPKVKSPDNVIQLFQDGRIRLSR